jgi:hypothetical protein
MRAAVLQQDRRYKTGWMLTCMKVHLDDDTLRFPLHRALMGNSCMNVWHYSAPSVLCACVIISVQYAF